MKYWPLLFLLILLLAGCGQAANTGEPPKIVYGQDVCDRCNMIISEEKYAAAYWTEAGEARRFDDIGGMLAYITENSEEVASYWVHDFETAEWMRAEEATYVMDNDLITPMGFGIIALADEALAETMAHGNDIEMHFTFAELLALNMTMPIGHEHDVEEIGNMDEGDGE